MEVFIIINVNETYGYILLLNKVEIYLQES